jgi:transposase-like protein
VKVNGVWRYVCRAIDQHGQVIDMLVSARRDAQAAGRFFTRALRTLKVIPSEVVTDAALVYPGVLDELLPAAWQHVADTIALHVQRNPRPPIPPRKHYPRRANHHHSHQQRYRCHTRDRRIVGVPPRNLVASGNGQQRIELMSAARQSNRS